MKFDFPWPVRKPEVKLGPHGRLHDVLLPYRFKVKYTVPRRKTVQEAVVMDHVSAWVPEVSGRDVKTVAEWVNVEFPDDFKRRADIPTKAITWSGGLYVPAGQGMEDSVPSDVLLMTLRRPQDATWHFVEIYQLERTEQAITDIGDRIRGDSWIPNQRLEKGIPARHSFVSSTQEFHRSVVQKIVNSLLIVDGTVWKKVPSIQLRLNLNMPKAWVTLVHGRYGYNDGERDDQAWWVDRNLRFRNYDLTEVGRLLAHVEDGVDLSWEVSDIKVHDAAAIRFDGSAEFTSRVMRSVTLHNEARLGQLSRERVEDWTWVRAVLDDYVAGRIEGFTDEDIDRLFSLMTVKLDGDYANARMDVQRRQIEAYRRTKWDGAVSVPTVGHYQISR